MTTTITTTSLHALYLRSENAAAGYLAAYKAARTVAQHVAGLAQLLNAHPRRIDYRAAWRKAVADHAEAVDRADLAYRLWQEASRAYDARWTATHGRTGPSAACLPVTCAQAA